jgi:hypothetical protein
VSIRAYRITEDHVNHGARCTILKDAIVYQFIGCDYGTSSGDTAHYGEECVSVTFESNGREPFFTVKRSLLEEVKAQNAIPVAGIDR